MHQPNFDAIKTRARVLGHILDSARPLSRRELSELMKCSLGLLTNHLRRLRQDGMISYEDGKARTVRATCRFIRVEDLV